MKKLNILVISLLCCFSAIAQNLSGVLTNDKNEPLFGATLLWEGTSIGTVTELDGSFEIPKQETTTNLEINYVGYETVYIEVLPDEDNLEISIEGIYDLMEIEVAAKVRDNYVSTLETFNVEVIGQGELRKAACCNLAESFSTNAAVEVAYSDAVTGAREIMMLGLRGAYSQMLIEKRPALTGLGSAFSLEYIPGTWLSGIQISKGSSTVQNGYQSITGQINAELVKPWQDKPLFVNLYGATTGRGEINLHLNKEWNRKWSSGLLLHASKVDNNIDRNKDNFYDVAQKELLDGMFRLFFRDELLRAQFNVHAIRDRHIAGQIEPMDNGQIYRIQQDHDRVEFFGKIGYLGFKNPNNSIGFIWDAAYHDLDSYYGNRHHSGVQNNFYGSLNYMGELGSEDQKLNLGASYLYDKYDEQLDDTDFSRKESVPGVYGEYSLNKEIQRKSESEEETKEPLKIGLTVGMRLDQHNMFGTLFTPRANFKLNLTENSVFRLSAGKGYRTANVIAENIGLLASSKAIVILEDMDMEEAWNFGINYVQNFDLGKRAGSLSFDLFRTEFVNQVIIDRDQSHSEVVFYNLNEESYSNSFLAMWSQDITDGFEFKLAYKFNDVKIGFTDGLRQRPLVARHRGLVNLDYNTVDEKWMFNTNLQIIGKQRFPHHHHLKRPDAPAYALVNAQITRKFRNFEVYIGGENLTNYTQDDPIIDWENPFGEEFDATQVYAPILGSMGYVGIRFSLDK